MSNKKEITYEKSKKAWYKNLENLVNELDKNNRLRVKKRLPMLTLGQYLEEMYNNG